jgi:hypothetical protein
LLAAVKKAPRIKFTGLVAYCEGLMLTFNEGKACDAIIRHIEARAKARRANIRLHDAHPQADRRIELTFEVGSTLYAMEHTGIEPFRDFMRMNGGSVRLYDPIVQAASARLPEHECVHLQMPHRALFGLSTKDLRKVQDALVCFAVDTAPSVPLRSYADYIGDLGPVTPPGVSFPVTLFRFHAPNTPYRFMIKHLLTGDTNAMRAERIRQACDDKFPKLAAWKADNRARTILILEDNDIQLTNQSIVTESFLPIANARDDRPDETYMLTTYGDTWYAWPILIDGVSFFDLSERYHPIHLEIDSSALTPVTSR